jgi:hypothetical protein
MAELDSSARVNTAGAPARPVVVALVAVHGVGRHETGASADAMANLLSGINGYSSPPGASPYTNFVTQPIQVPLPGAGFFPLLRRVLTKKELEELAKKGFWRRLHNPFEERREFFVDERVKYHWDTLPGVSPPPDIADEFMKTQLNHYAGDPLENTLRTVRIEGHRAAGGGKPAADVHIYDMQWSDLSSGNNSFIRFFMSLYQLILHLASLGRIAVDHAALENGDKLDWLVLSRSLTYAVRIFSLFVVNLLVILPVVAFSPLTLLLQGKNDLLGGQAIAAMAIAAALFFIFVIFGVVLLSQRWKPPLGSAGWWPWIFLTAILSVALPAIVFVQFPGSVWAILTAEWWLIGAAVVTYIFKKYAEVRPGAILVGSIEMLLVAAGFIACLIYRGNAAPVDLRTASFWMIQYIFLAVRIAWMLFMALMIVSALSEAVCRLRLRRVPAKDDGPGKLARARAALRTGRFAVAVPATLFLILTNFLWSGLYHFTAHRVQLFDGVELGLAPLLHRLPILVLSPEASSSVLRAVHWRDPGNLQPSYHFLEGLLIQSAPPGLPVVLGFIGAGLSFLVLLALPSVFFEFRTPYAAPNGKAELLGSWLSSGLQSFRWVIWCFWIAAFAVPFAYLAIVKLAIFLHWIASAPTFLETVYEFKGMVFTAKLLSAGGALIAGSAALLLGVLVKNLSAALDAILDVDNYLRTFPENNTPRARIVERYVSLLRYLHCYRAPDGKPYDRIVIVAHSLGSMISADLLRFLDRGSMRGLTQFAFADHPEQRIPICLFTMGSPLRQLMNRFFPHLYLWIRPVPDGAVEAPAIPVEGGQIPAKASPVPKLELAVERWINYYRSGDYIGRSIWEDGWFIRNNAGSANGAYPASPAIFEDAGSTRVEACIGLGAHTHYWDRTAPDVAEKLNELIQAAFLAAQNR